MGKHIDVEAAWRAYQELGSVHKVGAIFGVTGDTIHSKLKKAGFRLNSTKWSQAEDEILQRSYNETPTEVWDLALIASSLSRSRAAVALRASRLGLTNSKRRSNLSARKAMAARAQEWHSKNDHPRGAAGMTHSAETKRTISRSSLRAWTKAKATGSGLMSEENRQRRSDLMVERQAAGLLRNGYSRGSQGRRADLGAYFFRSSWEANYARYLNMLVAHGKILRWEFEPDTFWFEDIRRGVRSYLPDFKIWPMDGGPPYYVEVKGWMDSKSATKLRRMKKYHPHVRVDLVGANFYKILCARYETSIPHWEKSGAKKPIAAVAQDAAPEPVEAAPSWLLA